MMNSNKVRNSVVGEYRDDKYGNKEWITHKFDSEGNLDMKSGNKVKFTNSIMWSLYDVAEDYKPHTEVSADRVGTWVAQKKANGKQLKCLEGASYTLVNQQRFKATDDKPAMLSLTYAPLDSGYTI